MKIRHIVLALALASFGHAVMASQCPSMVAEIDAILATNPKLSDADLEKVKMLRNQGEMQHKQGKHDESVDTLEQALSLLGQ